MKNTETLVKHLQNAAKRADDANVSVEVSRQMATTLNSLANFIEFGQPFQSCLIDRLERLTVMLRDVPVREQDVLEV